MGRLSWVIVAWGLAGCVAAPDAGDPFGSGAEGGPASFGSDGSSESGEAQTSTGSTEGASGDESSGDSGTEPLPPFACDAVLGDSPVLDGLVLFDPAQPHPGDTLNVIVRATNGLGRADAPPLSLEVTRREGVETLVPQATEGGQVLYYFSIPDVSEGDVCVRGLIDGATERGSKITVTPRPPGPPVDGGVFKVVANHMWTCAEQPSFGNELHVWVRDENGQGLSGVPVALRPVDSTDPGSIYNGDGEPLPAQIVTGADGHAMAFNYWPISDNGLLVFNVAVDGVASDVATEITTGWWEDDGMGCNYCNTPTVNVWGHWSYTVEFQRDPSATEACVVANDHAGMAACGEPRHIHHHPDVQACWAP